MAEAWGESGTVVSACSLVRDGIPELGVVAGSPAMTIDTRTGELTYNTVYRPLFH